MGTRTLSVELPDELVALLGTPEVAAARAREALVLDLLRQARISQGKAAELLGLSRWDLLELMVQHRIESGPETAVEMAQEIDEMRRWAASQGPRASGQ
jgi:predicted HTH domain antitoxin